MLSNTVNPRNMDSDKQTEALQIEDQIITNPSQIKLLGVEIVDKLNFTNLVSNICIRASQKVEVLLRLRNLIPYNAKLIIYESSMLPLLIYIHFCRLIVYTFLYYMANPVLGKSLCSDWFFLGQDFAVRTVSTETVQPVYFCFGAKPANSKFATKTAKKNCEYCHSSQGNYQKKLKRLKFFRNFKF